MKVKFSFPVLGVLALKNTKPITLGDWKFCFRRNRKTKTINRLDIILSNVDRDSWPHLIEAKEKQTPEAVPIFPFEVQPNAFGFSKIRQTLVQLESLLGFYGVYEFDFRSVTEEWILESDDEQGSLFSKWSQSRSLPIVEPATEALLVRCIVAAGRDIPDVQSLPHFRMAQAAFHNGYFIEAVRYSYLFLEQMFACGHHHRKKTVAAFSRSQRLTAMARRWMCDENGHYNKLKTRRPELDGNTNTEKLFDYMFLLRGKLQHANARRINTWSPSKQSEFELDAICLIELCGDIAADIVRDAFRQIQQPSQKQQET